MILSFALWGVGDILSSGNSQLAAKVGSEKITLDEFYHEFQNTVSNYNQATNSNLSLRDAYDIQLHNLLLNDLIFSKMVNNYAKKYQIYINEETLKAVIKKMPQFKNSDGNFSNLKYKNYINSNFANEELFLKQIENKIYQGLVYETFNMSNSINEKIINYLYQFESEKRAINYLIFDKSKIDLDINDNLINEYFKKNQNDFEIREKTIVDYLEINLKDFIEQSDITEDQLMKYYELNIEQYIEKENRNIEFVRFNNLSDAMNYYDISNEFDKDKKSQFVKSKTLTINTIENFTGGTFSDQINKSIFNLKLNETSKPLSYDNLGYYVFKVLKIKPQIVKSFNEVKDEIKNYIASENAYIEFDNAINIADEMLINDFSLNDISQEIFGKLENVTENMKEFKSKLGQDKILDNNKPIGFISEILINENIAYIYTIKDREPSYVPKIEDIKEKVLQEYSADFKEKQLELLTKNTLTRKDINSLSKFREFALSKNLKISINENLSRDNKEFTAETIDGIFKKNKNDLFKVVLQNGDIGVGIISDIIKIEDIQKNDFYNSVEANIINNFNSTLESIMSNKIIQDSEYQIYEQNIDRLFM